MRDIGFSKRGPSGRTLSPCLMARVTMALGGDKVLGVLEKEGEPNELLLVDDNGMSMEADLILQTGCEISSRLSVKP